MTLFHCLIDVTFQTSECWHPRPCNDCIMLRRVRNCWSYITGS